MRLKKSDIVYSDKHRICVRIRETMVCRPIERPGPVLIVADSYVHWNLRYLGQERRDQPDGRQIGTFPKDLPGIRAIDTLSSRNKMRFGSGGICRARDFVLQERPTSSQKLITGI